MTTNKNVEEMKREFVKKHAHGYIGEFEKEVDDFLLHAHNEGYKAGLEKAVEKVGEWKNDGENPTEADLVLENVLKSLTQLITSNNEVK